MDRRTKKQKLQAMANQSVSPHEAEIAKQKLEELGPEEEPVKADIEFYFYPTSGVKASFWTGSFNFAKSFREYTYDFVKKEWRKVD